MKVYRIHQGEEIAVYDLMEVTYSGKDMGERSLTAKILTDHIIDFKIGDYVKLEMQNLMRSVNGYAGGMMEEKFYLYNLPTIKKTARNESSGNAFEMTVVFYPRQYELGLIQMRDLLQKDASGKDIIFTGFSEVKFYGGAHELLMRIQAVLDDYFKDKEQEEKWSYVLSDEVNEHKNPALESFSFTFSDNSLMDALLKLNDPEGINTTFFINGRTIYVGFKRPYMCRVQTSPQDDITVSQYPFELAYGKTSHLPLDKHSGGLFDITKTPGKESPITKLYAYGGSRNLNRYYNADVVKSGRYVNKLMLPSFSHDGKTDYIFRQEMIDKFGLREGAKQFENVFPSIENIRYGYIRSIKYCIKILTKGHGGEEDNYPIMRIQCFKVVPILDANGKDTGINTLQESYPPEDLAIYIHGYQDDSTVRESKVLKCVLYTNQQRQSKEDFGHLPTDENGAVIPGACYVVHDRGFDEEGTQYICDTREDWFTYVETARTEEEKEILQNQLQYVDDFWATDVHVFKGYDSDVFIRDGYSMYCYPRINANYPNGANSDSLLVNEVVAVRPITKTDTVDGRASEDVFDIYMRDLGFRIDEQSLGGGGGNGQMVFLTQGNILVHFKTGNLAGMEFTVRYQNGANSSVFCAFMEDGTRNDEFFRNHDDNLTAEDPFALEAFENGAIWRFRAERQAAEPDYRADYYLPNKDCNAQAGDRVVLLDICMPDIYIKAAERKLEEEAWKYYDKNCKDHTAFSVSFDKVRFQQIPLYALQMREGLNLRIIDDDLKIQMENYARDLRHGMSGLTSGKSLEVQDMEYYYIEETSMHEFYHYKSHLAEWQLSKDDENLLAKIRLPRVVGDTLSDTMIINVVHENNRDLDNKYRDATSYIAKIDTESIVRTIDNHFEFYIEFSDKASYDAVVLAEDLYDRYYTTKLIDFYLPELERHARPSGEIYYKSGLLNSDTDELIPFKAGKFYEVEIGLLDALLNTSLMEHSLFMLTDQIGDKKTSYYIPDYTMEVVSSEGNGITRYRFKFQLPENFNDAKDYYISVVYSADGTESYAYNILYSVIEKDFAEGSQVLKYRDFIADQVTIKIQDNTRDEGYRLVKMIPEAIKEISATLAEKTSASSWAALNNKVEELSNESDQVQQTQEMRARDARINAFNLMQLRENIFDPDAGLDRYERCSPDFLRKMMLQIGADSMNFQLDKTYQGADGTAHNYTLGYSQQYSCDVFNVLSADVLRHFVFNRQDGQSSWNIPANSKQLVASGGVYPVYYVSIKCSISDNTGQWVIDTLMHKVNEEANYFYFNWGILMPDTDGHYTLMETRGCAYMYGDNLVVGKISDLSKNSYFDLNNGNFVLSNGDPGGAALSYINGVLSIKGISDQIIGGDNLCDIPEHYENIGFIGENQYSSTFYIPLGTKETDYRYRKFVAGKYVLGAKNIECTLTRAGGMSVEYRMTIDLVTSASSSSDDILTGLESNYTNREFELLIDTELYLKVFVDTTPEYAEESSLVIDELMIQMGTKLTSYSRYSHHITDAMKSSTEIAGGLLMSNLLMLKNEKEEVISGMSGLQGTPEDPENVLLWSGGTYQNALDQLQGLINKLPVLITKSGIDSKIGNFEVKENCILLKTSEGRIEMSNNGIYIYRNGADNPLISITPALIDIPRGETVNFTMSAFSEKYLDTSSNSSIRISNYVDVLRSGMKLSISNIRLSVNVPRRWHLRQNVTIYLRLQYAAPGSSYYTPVFTQYIGNLNEWDSAMSGTYDINYSLYYLSAGNYFWDLYFEHTAKEHNGVYHVDPYQSLTFSTQPYTSGSMNSKFEDLSGVPTMQIRSDGILVYQNPAKYVAIKNSDNDIQIVANGLPVDPTSLAPGTIWNDGGTLKITS